MGENAVASERAPASSPMNTLAVKPPMRVTGSCGWCSKAGRYVPGRLRQRDPELDAVQHRVVLGR